MKATKLFWFNLSILGLGTFLTIVRLLLKNSIEEGDRNAISYFITTLFLFCTGLELVRFELADLRKKIAPRDEVEIKRSGS